MMTFILIMRVVTKPHITYELGVEPRVWHFEDYRRATVGPRKDASEDFSFINSEEVVYDNPVCDMVSEA